MKFLVKSVLLCLGVYVAVQWYNGDLSVSSLQSLVPFAETETTLSTSDEALQNAFDNRLSNLQVGGSGKVVKILSDDNDGIRHQKFILKLRSGQTLLMAHNIDLAPRIDGLAVGDHVNFYGEYEWNSKGGVVHWTHHDPDGRHEDGWLNHGDRLYQ